MARSRYGYTAPVSSMGMGYAGGKAGSGGNMMGGGMPKFPSPTMPPSPKPMPVAGKGRVKALQSKLNTLNAAVQAQRAAGGKATKAQIAQRAKLRDKKYALTGGPNPKPTAKDRLRKGGPTY